MILKKFFEAKKLRTEKVNQARENFVSWLEISNSLGWKCYQEAIDKKIENIKSRIETDMSLTGEDLKRLQLALSVWNEVLRVPKDLESKAKGKR